MGCFRHIAIIVAAGKGLRMQSKKKKQYMELDKIPVLTRTIMAFESHGKINDIILVLPADDMDFCSDTIVQPFDFKTPIHFVAGGQTRQESVFNGLLKARELSQTLDSSSFDKAPFNKTSFDRTSSDRTSSDSIPFDRSFVLIHDGVRPFIDKQLIDNCMDKAKATGACIPGIKITDTVKQVIDKAWITKTLDRDLLYRAQTPQVFRLDLVLKAFEFAKATSFLGTDEASLLEHAKIPVSVTKGSVFNIKLTTREDLVMAKYLLDNL
jgi:2-C-methyl-D-erythritol 4-phosphate cytidylyltransferase